MPSGIAQLLVPTRYGLLVFARVPLAAPFLSAPLTLNRLVDLLPMDRNVGGRVNAKADFVPSDIHNRNNNVVADDDALVSVSR
jgi:hypothetical protein